jgi:biopolymer transport protein ExbD
MFQLCCASAGCSKQLEEPEMSSRRAKRMEKHHKRSSVGELNLVSMIDIFTILVFFLLVNSQVVQTLILGLNLPGAATTVESSEPEFALEVIVRANQIEVGDRNAGVFSVIPQIDGEYDVESLTRKLKDVKATFPDQLSVTLLLESDIDYESMVRVMDAVRSYQPEQKGVWRRAELFPEISIGDAPALIAANK